MLALVMTGYFIDKPNDSAQVYVFPSFPYTIVKILDYKIPCWIVSHGFFCTQHFDLPNHFKMMKTCSHFVFTQWRFQNIFIRLVFLNQNFLLSHLIIPTTNPASTPHFPHSFFLSIHLSIHPIAGHSIDPNYPISKTPPPSLPICPNLFPTHTRLRCFN